MSDHEQYEVLLDLDQALLTFESIFDEKFPID